MKKGQPDREWRMNGILVQKFDSGRRGQSQGAEKQQAEKTQRVKALESIKGDTEETRRQHQTSYERKLNTGVRMNDPSRKPLRA